jgi:DNA-binding transcriptional LysR family regulator
MIAAPHLWHPGTADQACSSSAISRSRIATCLRSSHANPSSALAIAAAVGSTLPLRTALLMTGRFLSMVPRVVMQFPPKNTLLRILPINLPGTERPLALITLKNRTLNPLAQLFADYAREAGSAKHDAAWYGLVTHMLHCMSPELARSDNCRGSTASCRSG